MGKFDTWTISCKLCDWQWETCSSIIAKHPRCPQCDSTDCFVEKNEIVTIKKKGKIITDVGPDLFDDKSGDIDGEVLVDTTKTDKPLMVIKKDDFRFLEDMSNEDRRRLLEQIDSMKHKIIRDIIDNEN